MFDRKYVRILVFWLIGSVCCGFNLWSGCDHASSDTEVLSAAVADIDQGNCQDAIARLATMQDHPSDYFRDLGWAQLCAGGATLSSLASSVYTFSSSSSAPLTIFGSLANSILTGANGQNVTIAQAQTNISNAVSTFGGMTAGKEQAMCQAIAAFADAAAVVALASSDGKTVHQADIAGASCNTDPTCASCAAGCAAQCGSATGGNFNDADAQLFLVAINQASTILNSSSTLGSLSELNTFLVQHGLTTAVNDATRCFIFNQMLTN